MQWSITTAAVVLCGSLNPAVAVEAERTALRVCADPSQPPASTRELTGYENRIAELFGKSLGLPVEYTWFPQRMGFIRRTLKNFDNETGTYPCDLVMEAPERFELAATTIPYFRSTWVFVYAKGRGIDGVESIDQLKDLPREKKDALRIGVFDRSPAARWLMSQDLYRSMVSFQSMTGDLADYPGKIIENEMVKGEIDAAIVWGPIAGYAAKRLEGVELVILPMPVDTGFKFDFQMHMAVRHGEEEWRETINGLIRKHQAEIDAILTEFGVPLLPLKAAAAPQDDD
jgi:quinoprotein dehydrogenase-associated probable ABC transporter substrate-binding protein